MDGSKRGLSGMGSRRSCRIVVESSVTSDRQVPIMSTLTGGCFCGAIRYEIDAVPPVVNCHCTMCRRTSAAPYVTWLIAPATDFRYTHGEPRKLQSSDHGTREFCPDCGTPITCVSTRHSERVDVTLGSLDDPTELTPTGDFYEDTRLPWVKPLQE